jgi:hypothetical protein
MALLRPLKHDLLWCRFSAVPLPLLLLAISACQPQKAAEGRGLLPAAPPDQVTSAAPPSAAPFDQPLGNAAFARTVFHTQGPQNIEITVRDVIVGPHAEVQLAAAAGPVLMDLTSGSGRAAAAGKTLDLSSEHPAAFPAGAAITLNNSGDVPLVVRLYTLEGK